MTYRFAAIVVAALFLSYESMQWFLGVRQVMPSAKIPSFQQIDPVEHERNKFKGDNDDVRDGLRREVHDTAKELIKNPCNAYFRDRYVAAATKYARAHLSIAPCLERANCNSKKEVAQLELVWKAFKTPFDDTVTDLMREVHGSGAIREGDFGQDVIVWVATTTKDIAINPIADPAIRREWIENRREPVCRP